MSFVLTIALATAAAVAETKPAGEFCYVGSTPTHHAVLTFLGHSFEYKAEGSGEQYVCCGITYAIHNGEITVENAQGCWSKGERQSIFWDARDESIKVITTDSNGKTEFEYTKEACKKDKVTVAEAKPAGEFCYVGSTANRHAELTFSENAFKYHAAQGDSQYTCGDITYAIHNGEITVENAQGCWSKGERQSIFWDARDESIKVITTDSNGKTEFEYTKEACEKDKETSIDI